jgi:predicted membrane protein
MNKKFVIHFLLGIIVALIAALIMFDGSIFGENTSGIAIVIGMIGIGIIGSSHIWSMKK